MFQHSWRDLRNQSCVFPLHTERRNKIFPSLFCSVTYVQQFTSFSIILLASRMLDAKPWMIFREGNGNSEGVKWSSGMHSGPFFIVCPVVEDEVFPSDLRLIETCDFSRYFRDLIYRHLQCSWTKVMLAYNKSCFLDKSAWHSNFSICKHF